jgi:hypothetical protein
LETYRISHAAFGWPVRHLLGGLMIFAFSSGPYAQNLPVPATTGADTSQLQSAPADTLSVPSVSPPDDTTFLPDTIPPLPSDTAGVRIDTTESVRWALAADSISVSVYQERRYTSKGPDDEMKGLPGHFLKSMGPVGSPAILVDYLNVAGTNITIDGLPFPYNGIYRPYEIGVDLNSIPWETLNLIQSENSFSGSDESRRFGGGLSLALGPPSDRANKSDIEVARGPYGYNSTRWRFFRPFTGLAFAYFTVGFKKSRGFYENSDYDGFHVTGGLSRNIAGGRLSIDLWNHRAKSGTNSFDYFPLQSSRQSREIKRAEIRYSRGMKGPLSVQLTGLYNRSAQTISGYSPPIRTKYDIGGGIVEITDSIGAATISLATLYLNSVLYGLDGIRPILDHFGVDAKFEQRIGTLDYYLGLQYAWNDIDKKELFPSAGARISTGAFKPYLRAFRSRELPDLYLTALKDSVSGLGIPGVIQSYSFRPNSNLASPVLTQATAGVNSHIGPLTVDIGGSFKKIDSQIYLSYSADSLGNLDVSPANFDDSYTEYYGSLNAEFGPISFDFNGAVRFWREKYFPDGLEKDPVAIGSGRVSLLKELFIPKLYLGGSLEAQAASRRDYRSITIGHTDAFIVTNGRLEFRYKDFTFWLNDDNLLNDRYITWWPYYQSPRSVWWGIRWNFFE